MNELTIKNEGDIHLVGEFITDCVKFRDENKNIVLSGDEDVAFMTAISKQLKTSEVAGAKGVIALQEIFGIDKLTENNADSRVLRLNYEKQVQKFKDKLKSDAVDWFLEHSKELILHSQASEKYKQSIDIHQIATDTISGKKKGLMDAVKDQLEVLKSGLVEDETQTISKLEIINQYKEHLRKDADYLVNLPIEALKPEMENRILQEQERTRIAQENAVEQERLKIKADDQLAEQAVELSKKHETQEAIRQATKENKPEKQYKFTMSFITTKQNAIKIKGMADSLDVEFYDKKTVEL